MDYGYIHTKVDINKDLTIKKWNKSQGREVKPSNNTNSAETTENS